MAIRQRAMNGFDYLGLFIVIVLLLWNGSGFTTLERWVGEYDILFLKRNNREPMVVLPWRVWRSLLQRS